MALSCVGVTGRDLQLTQVRPTRKAIPADSYGRSGLRRLGVSGALQGVRSRVAAIAGRYTWRIKTVHRGRGRPGVRPASHTQSSVGGARPGSGSLGRGGLHGRGKEVAGW